jgi:hypothetical protein
MLFIEGTPNMYIMAGVTIGMVCSTIGFYMYHRLNNIITF